MARLQPDLDTHLPRIEQLAPAGCLALPLAGSQLGLDGRSYATWGAPAGCGDEGGDGPPVDAGGLTLPDPEGPELQLSLALEDARLTALEPKRIEMLAKVRQATSETSAKWAADRARAMGQHLSPRVRECGRKGHAVRCGCGPRVLWRGCRQWWVCAPCRQRRLRPLGRKLRDSIELRVGEEQRGGRRVALRLVTLTLRTSGNVDDDRRELGEITRRWYKAMNKWVGKYHYAGVYEVTPGSTGSGHVHAHLVVLWPRWLDYGRVRKLWLAAAAGRSDRISIVGGRGDAGRAAGYLAKYLSKGSEQLAPRLAGEVIAAFYARRAVTTSWKFWKPDPKVCPCCGDPVRLDGTQRQHEQTREAFRRGVLSMWARMSPPAPAPVTAEPLASEVPP